MGLRTTSYARLVHTASLLAFVLVTTGCVVGQTLPFEHDPSQSEVIVEDQRLVVTVEDHRPYVLSGSKPTSFVGKYRAGFGNPWDVSTESGEPLADILERDLAELASAMGFSLVDSEARQLQVEILEWNLDAYQNGRFWCDLKVSVTDNTGQQLASDRIEYAHYLKGSFWVGGKAGAEREMPKAYGEVIDRILGSNQSIQAALKED